MTCLFPKMQPMAPIKFAPSAVLPGAAPLLAELPPVARQAAPPPSSNLALGVLDARLEHLCFFLPTRRWRVSRLPSFPRGRCTTRSAGCSRVISHAAVARGSSADAGCSSLVAALHQRRAWLLAGTSPGSLRVDSVWGERCVSWRERCVFWRVTAA